MSPHSVLILLLLVHSTSSLKYVYVDRTRDWEDAQEFCQKEFTDLAPVSSEYDMKLLEEIGRNRSDGRKEAWLGLMRNPEDGKWMWSGGAEVTTSFWDNGEPSPSGTFGMLRENKWKDTNEQHEENPFFCYKVHAVREKMTWEEALDFCRVNHKDLASVASETEMMLMRNELLKRISTTEQVWVGLHFLAGEWLWMDGQPLGYEAWGPNEQVQCPEVRRRCGALRVNGTLENTDESEFMVRVEYINEWNARDCTEKLHFLCY